MRNLVLSFSLLAFITIIPVSANAQTMAEYTCNPVFTTTDVTPNVLFVMADQLTALALEGYGNAMAITSRIDRLTVRGADIVSHYCSYPKCTLPRQSMVCGWLPSSL